ncbi:MAG: hypothetical protein KME26_18675 [Oscillatoria princeps RMCB-10]|jgi:hypothetical protein|nr:hypothetical protein [Oscillatoria princeps RMCB-10]
MVGLSELPAIAAGAAGLLGGGAAGFGGGGSVPVLQGLLPVSWTVLAQQVSNQDMWGQVVRSWNHFVSTGQIWALLIGIAVGYAFRGLTRY